MGSRIKQNPETTFEVYVEVAYPRTGGTLSGRRECVVLEVIPDLQNKDRLPWLAFLSSPNWILRCRGNSQRTTVTRKFYRL
uniref:DENN domain containing 1A n=1 Tax=Mus musculus TaxID=10090 RepID=D6RHP6_MOUSE